MYRSLSAQGPIHPTRLPNGRAGPARHQLPGSASAARRPPAGQGRLPATMNVRELLPELPPALVSHMLQTGPPDCTRLRAMVAPAFTRRRMDRLAPRIQQIAEGLADHRDLRAARHRGGRSGRVPGLVGDHDRGPLCRPGRLRRRHRLARLTPHADRGQAAPSRRRSDVHSGRVRELPGSVSVTDLVAGFCCSRRVHVGQALACPRGTGCPGR